MVSDGKISVDIVANEKGFTAQLDSLAGIAKGAFSKALGGLAAIGFGKGLVDASVKAIELASAAQQTANRVNAVFPEMSDTINAFASRAMHDMGLSGGAAKTMAAQFGMMAQGMGFTEKQAAGMSMQLTQLAGDMAAFYGITAEEAQGKLSGIFTGMTRGLKQIGVDMSEANLQAHALSLGIQQDVSSMSDAQLAALRLSYAQKQLAVTSGYAKQNLNTWAGQTQLLRQQVNALLSSMGKGLIAAFLPVLKVINAVIAGLIKVANAFNAMVERITGKKFSELMGGAAGVTMELGDAADSAGVSTGGLSDAQDKAAKAAEKQDRAQKKLNRTLAGFDKINKLVSESTSNAASGGSTGGVGGIGDSINSLGGFGDMFEGEVEQAQSALDSLTLPPALEAAFANLWEKAQGLADTISDGLKWAWDNILAPFGAWIVNDFGPPFVNAIAGAIDVLDALLEIVGEAFGPIWNELLAPIVEMLGDNLVVALQNISDGLDVFAGWLRSHKDEITQPFRDLAELVGLLKDEAVKISIIAEEKGPVAAVIQLYNDLASGEITAPEKLELVLSASGVLGPQFQTIYNYFQWAKSYVMPKISDLVLTAKGVVSGAWDTAYNAFKNAASFIVNRSATINGVVKGSVSKAWAKIQAAFKWAKKGIYNKTKTISANATSFISSGWNNAVKQFNWAKKNLRDITATIGIKISSTLTNISSLISGVLHDINQKAKGLTWPTGGKVFPNGIFPGYAQGAWVARNTPHLAVIGDNRREGEIVSPESKFQAMLDKASAQGGGAEQLLPVLSAILTAIQQSDNAVYLDGKAISRRVVRDVNAITQATGRSPILV